MKKIIIFFLALVFIFYLIFGIYENWRETGVESYFKQFSIEFNETPLINKTVNLVCSLTQRDRDSNISLEIELSEGFELIGGELKKEIYLGANQSTKHIISIRTVKTGQWRIRAWAGPSSYPKYEVENIYVTVYKDKSIVSRYPFSPPLKGRTKSNYN